MNYLSDNMGHEAFVVEMFLEDKRKERTKKTQGLGTWMQLDCKLCDFK